MMQRDFENFKHRCLSKILGMFSEVDVTVKEKEKWMDN